jgi:hypothetical protein
MGLTPMGEASGFSIVFDLGLSSGSPGFRYRPWRFQAGHNYQYSWCIDVKFVDGLRLRLHSYTHGIRKATLTYLKLRAPTKVQ